MVEIAQWLALLLQAGMVSCQIDGVATFTDREDLCDQGQALALPSNPISVVDPWLVPLPEPREEAAPIPAPVPTIVERIIHVPIYPDAPPSFYPGSIRIPAASAVIPAKRQHHKQRRGPMPPPRSAPADWQGPGSERLRQLPRQRPGERGPRPRYGSSR